MHRFGVTISITALTLVLAATGCAVTTLVNDANTIGEMIFVPGGTFPAGGNSAAPKTIGDFYIARFETTNLQYAEFLNSALNQNLIYIDPADNIVKKVGEGVEYFELFSHDDTRGISWGGSVFSVLPGMENHPVVNVSWYGAVAYCDWLSARNGRIYRLPTEWQWEYAAAWKADTSTYYTYGFMSNAISCDRCNYRRSDFCVGTTTPVGHYNGDKETTDSPSPSGCYDMSGNVWEWTATVHSTGPLHYVLRGGAWYYNQNYCTVSYRLTDLPAARSFRVFGFRVAIDL